MSYPVQGQPLSPYSCKLPSFQVCHANQTPLLFAMAPCVSVGPRARGVPALPTLPPELAFMAEPKPLAKPAGPPVGTLPRIKTVANVKAAQAKGELPHTCRGRDCSGKQFIDALDKRFEIVHGALTANEKLAGKHILILLPNKEARSIEQVMWLLEMHADFSGRTGKIHMNQVARDWFQSPAGVAELSDAHLGGYHSKLLGFIPGVEKAINQIVQREKLGAPLRLRDTGKDDLDAQLNAWLKQSRGDKGVAGELLEQVENLKSLRVSLARSVLPQPQQSADQLSFTVLAGQAANVDLAQELSYPGLVLRPAVMAAPQWTVADLTDHLAQRETLLVEFIDLKRKAASPALGLHGHLLLLGVDHDEGIEGGVNLASRVVSALREHPKGTVAVNVLQVPDSLAMYDKGQKTHIVDDAKLLETVTENKRFEELRDQVLNTINAASMQEPLDSQAYREASFLEFQQMANSRIQGISNPQARRAAAQALKACEVQYDKTAEAYTARWTALFADMHKVMDQAQHSKELYVLALPMDIGRAVASLVQTLPSIMEKFGDRVLVGKVTERMSAEALLPHVGLI